MNLKNCELRVLDAGYGDSIFLSIKKANTEFNILIDGGLASTYFNPKNKRQKNGPLKLLLEELKENAQSIDLLVVTHIDDDHIGGISKWFEMDFPEKGFIKRIWLNNDIYIKDSVSLNNSVQTAISVFQKLQQNQISYRSDIVKGIIFSNELCTIRVLAPRLEYRNIVADKIKASLDNTAKKSVLPTINELLQQDWVMCTNTEENKASIAFELEIWDGTKMLMLGDSEYEDVLDGLNGFYKNSEGLLEYAFVKLSHHGSKNNFHPSFLSKIHARTYIVSTNGKKFGHPDKEVLAQIISNSDSFIIFNNQTVMNSMFCEQDFEDYPDLNQRISIF